MICKVCGHLVPRYKTTCPNCLVHIGCCGNCKWNTGKEYYWCQNPKSGHYGDCMVFHAWCNAYEMGDMGQ